MTNLQNLSLLIIIGQDMPATTIFSSTLRQRTISVGGAKVWNELPGPIKEDRSFESFKTKLKELLLNHCK